MSRQPLGWYVRRLRRMSPTELVWRTRDHARRTAWAYQQVRPGQDATVHLPLRKELTFPVDAARRTPRAPYRRKPRKAVIATADAILAGKLEVLGVDRTDLQSPDWFRDPITGRRSDPAQYAFKLNHRNEDAGRERQAGLGAVPAPPPHPARRGLVPDPRRRVRRARRRPPERLVAVEPVPVRRALGQRDRDRHPADQLGLDPAAAGRLARGHRPVRAQRARAAADLLAPALPRRVPEPRLVGEQPRDRRGGRPARRRLRVPLVRRERALAARRGSRCWSGSSTRNTFPSGVNRELASDYHRFVSELGLYAALEADNAGHPLSPQTWSLLTRTVDVAAAIVDDTLRPPRQGDDDEGMVLVLDPPDVHQLVGVPVARRRRRRPRVAGGRDARRRRPSVTRSARLVDGTQPRSAGRAAGALRRRRADDPAQRTATERGPEIWCRADAGPHGFLSIAAHAHCDALSLEVRRRRRRHPGRPGHVLLPRRGGLAELLPLDHRPQHRRGRRRRAVRLGRPVPLAPRRNRPRTPVRRRR